MTKLKDLTEKYAGELDFRFTHERKKEILAQAIEETARVAFEDIMHRIKMINFTGDTCVTAREEIISMLEGVKVKFFGEDNKEIFEGTKEALENLTITKSQDNKEDKIK